MQIYFPFFFIKGSILYTEKAIATHSSILAWQIPWTEELVGHKKLDTTETT